MFYNFVTILNKFTPKIKVFKKCAVIHVTKGSKGIEKMGLNITHTNSFNFENRNNMMNTARDILKKQSDSSESAEKFVEEIFVNNKETDNSNLAIIKASYQMNINNSLKETLRYLKQHSNKKSEKKLVFGEIWNMVSKDEEYNGELVDFVIDENLENIFAA